MRRCLLVLSERRSHLQAIFALLTEHFNVDADCIGYLVGGMKPEDLARSLSTARVLLATFQFAAEGVDVPRLNAAFLTTSKGDIQQSVGRVLRCIKEDVPPIIYDYVDNNSVFQNQSARRARYYKKQGYRIIYLK